MYNAVKFSDLSFSHTYSETVNKNDYFSHHHADYEMLYIRNGSGIFLTDDLTYEFFSQSLIVTPPGRYHHVSKLPEKDYDRCVIFFSPELLPAEIEKPKSTLIPKLKNNLIDLFEKFDRYADKYKGEILHLLFKSLLTEILVNLAFEKQSNAKAQQKTPQLVAEAIRYIDSHVDEKISIEKLAGELFCSVSYLQHLFNCTMDINIKKYIIIKKMYKAHELLQNGVPAQQVSENLGYGDYSTFYRNYISIFNSPPLNKKR